MRRNLFLTLFFAITLLLNTSCIAQEHLTYDGYETYLVVKKEGVPYYWNNKIAYYRFNGHYYYPYFDQYTQRPMVVITDKVYRPGFPPPPPHKVRKNIYHFSPNFPQRRYENKRPVPIPSEPKPNNKHHRR